MMLQNLNKTIMVDAICGNIPTDPKLHTEMVKDGYYSTDGKWNRDKLAAQTMTQLCWIYEFIKGKRTTARFGGDRIG